MINRWHRLRHKLLHRLRRRLRARLRPAPPRRILGEMAALIALHFVLVQILARARLLEHLLSPGPGATFALAVTAFFLLLRIFLIALGPSWLLARLWLWASHPETRRKPPGIPMPLR